MKLLRINGSVGEFLAPNNEYRTVDLITKEDLMRLVNLTISDDEALMDKYDETLLKNEAHRVIYRSVERKLSELAERRSQFADDAARVFLSEYNAYRQE